MNLELFWAKVDKSGDCWQWTAYIDTEGYGRFGANPRRCKAHRISYELVKGEIPKGLFVDHICHNRACVNPDHLRLATNKQNLENMKGARSDSKSGIRGVSWHKRDQKWHAQMMHNGKQHHVGMFENIEDAEAAVVAKRLELYTHNEADKKAA